ncbi:TolC family outer membrane protein [Phyllobacterium sp. 628]|uniref:TolC family outer membrane protein n=1 Tax=Phyllobacterium sp. 628 TaxID=2718938 RepID=UPI00166249E9|nr:TolC family outer membrane protein [Phyllobacterium sp. 628]
MSLSNRNERFGQRESVFKLSEKLTVSITAKRSLTAILLMTSVLTATPSMAETIFGAMSKAYQNNSTLNANRAGVRVTDENVAIAKSGYRPTVNGQVKAGLTRSKVDGQDAGTRGTATDTLQVNQMLFDGFQTKNNVAAAKTGVLAAREDLRGSEQTILLTAVQAYMDVYLNRQIVALREKNLAFLNEQVRSNRARFDVGEGTRTDVAQAEASQATAVNDRNTARANVKIAEATYIQTTGSTPGSLSAAAPAKSLPKSLTQAYSIAQANHPSIGSAKFNTDSAGYKVKVNEGALLPSADLTGTVTRTDIFQGRTKVTPNNTLGSASLNVTIPIYGAGKTAATVRQSKESLAQRRVEVDVSSDSVRQTLASAWASLEAARASIAAQRSVVSAAQLALQGVIEERKVGQRTTLNVLEAQGTVITAQLALVQAERDSVVYSYQVVSALGRLTAKGVGLQVAEYKPEEHYQAVEDKWGGVKTPDGR